MIVTLTLTGRYPGKIRWGHGKRAKPGSAQARREQRYKNARDEIRNSMVVELAGRPLPLPPVRMGVAMYVRTKDGELPAGGACADYDNLRATVLDALQGCAICRKKAGGKSPCRCHRPQIVLRDDSPKWYRGSADAVEGGEAKRDGVYLAEVGEERIVVTLWEVES